MILRGLIDSKKLQVLFDNFTSFSGLTTAIVDLKGSIILASGWKELCIRFHRMHPETESRCQESDTVLSEKLNKGDSYNVYKCRNGLMDAAVPIIVSGDHIANFYIGQFLFEKPDLEFFIKQAEEYNFDKYAYVDALEKIPVYSEEYIQKAMNFIVSFIQLLGEAIMARKRVDDIREQLLIELKESEAKIKILSGLLPICASCKRIRNDTGDWEQFENYIKNRSEAEFSHSICPDCVKILYPGYHKDK